jgi:ubiquinone/menaquinone biosynthesis C-methylase UbiE
MQCLICRSKNVEEGILSTYHCKNCGHILRNYDNDLLDFHKTDFRKKFRRSINEFDSSGKVLPIFHLNRRGIVEARFELVKNHFNENQRVLDIGAGAGTFANLLRNNKNCIIDCIELDENLVEELNRLQFKTICSDFLSFDFNQKTYDIIYSWHVLEHILDCHAFFKKCSFLSKKFLIEIPINRKIPKKFDGHVHYFTKKSIEILAKIHEFKVLKLSEGIQKPALLIEMQRN